MSVDLICRSCGADLTVTFLDLGETPLANSLMSLGDVGEEWYPLHVRICSLCLLVQLPAVVPASEIFSDYVYFSSYSESWLEHSRLYAEKASLRWRLDETSQVVEVASNDGYLLQYFHARGIPVLGIEPAINVAQIANGRGLRTEVCFMTEASGARLARAGVAADLLIANNVLAHVPDVNDFVRGLAAILAPAGVLSIEVPHILRLIEGIEFDTIYHEHFSYFSLYALERITREHGLRIFEVEELPTHGGSIRLLICHAEAIHVTHASVQRLWGKEEVAGLHEVSGYLNLGPMVERVKADLRRFLRNARESGETVVAYGAAAKGNTLLNSSGISADSVLFVADRSPHKQGKQLPGSHIPVVHPDAIREVRPSFILILPWNIASEIMEQLSFVHSWGGRFVIPVPQIRILPEEPEWPVSAMA